MTHAFDTGLAIAQRTAIRNGAVTLLSGLLKANGGYLAAVIPWGGVIRGYTDDNGIDMLFTALNGRAPAIAIALGDRSSKPAGIGGYTFHGPIELLVYYFSNQRRDPVDGRLAIDVVGAASNTADPGLEVMMEHGEELLIGQRAGSTTSIKQIVPVAEEEIRTEDLFTLWVQRYAVTVDRVINPLRGVTELLVGMRSKAYVAGQTAPSDDGLVVADAVSGEPEPPPPDDP